MKNELVVSNYAHRAYEAHLTAAMHILGNTHTLRPAIINFINLLSRIVVITFAKEPIRPPSS